MAFNGQKPQDPARSRAWGRPGLPREVPGQDGDGGQLVATEMSHLGPLWKTWYAGEALDQARCPGTQEDKCKSNAPKGYLGTSLVALFVVKTSTSNAGGMGSVPG